MITATDTATDRRAQVSAVGASFFGWTFDAFDFFVLTFLLTDVARVFGESRGRNSGASLTECPLCDLDRAPRSFPPPFRQTLVTTITDSTAGRPPRKDM